MDTVFIVPKTFAVVGTLVFRGDAFVDGRLVYNHLLPMITPVVYDKDRAQAVFQTFLNSSPTSYKAYFAFRSLSGTIDGLARYGSSSCSISLDYGKFYNQTSSREELARVLTKIFVHEYTHYREWAAWGNSRTLYSSTSPKKYYYSKNPELNSWASDALIELSHSLSDDKIRSSIKNGNYSYLKGYSKAIRTYWGAETPLFQEFMRRILWLLDLSSNELKNKKADSAPPVTLPSPPPKTDNPIYKSPTSGGTRIDISGRGSVRINGVLAVDIDRILKGGGKFNIQYR